MDLIIRLEEKNRESVDLDRVWALLHAALQQEGYGVVAVGFPDNFDHRLRRPALDEDHGPTYLAATELTTEFVSLPGPTRPTEFWLAYPVHVATFDTAIRIACSWGKGATEEEALRRAGWQPPPEDEEN